MDAPETGVIGVEETLLDPSLSTRPRSPKESAEGSGRRRGGRGGASVDEVDGVDEIGRRGLDIDGG